MDAPASDKDVRGSSKFIRNMNIGATMSRGLFWLHASYLESQIVEEILSLNMFVFVVWWITAEEFPWDGEAFAKDKVGW